MNHSSRNSPCPVCDRNTDDKCRWSDEFVLCYNGDSFAPPEFLRIGDKIRIDNKPFALCSTNSGFASNSYCFALVDEVEYRFLKYDKRREFRRECVAAMKVFLRKKKKVFDAAEMIDLDENLQALTLQELLTYKNATQKISNSIQTLIEHATSNKRYIVDYLSEVNAMLELQNKLSYALEEIDLFEKINLGIRDFRALSPKSSASGY